MIPTNTHMTSIPTLPRLLILVIGLLIVGGIKAHTIDVLEETFTTFAVNQNATITDAVRYNPTTRAAQVDTTLWVRHKVELFFNTEVLPAADAGKDFKCTVVVEITKRFDSSVSTETPFQKTLTAYYDKNLGVVFDGESAYFFEDIKYRVRYKIISIAYEVDGISVGSVTTGLFGLRGVMMIDRVWKMSLTSYMSLASPSYSGILMRLTSSWTAFQGAEEYDFEWTFYDTLSAVYVDYNANTTYTGFEELFRDYASRMTVNTNFIRIRMVYPLGGVFLFRVRPVRYGKPGEREVGKWSSEAYSSILAVLGCYHSAQIHEPFTFFRLPLDRDLVHSVVCSRSKDHGAAWGNTWRGGHELNKIYNSVNKTIITTIFDYGSLKISLLGTYEELEDGKVFSNPNDFKGLLLEEK